MAASFYRYSLELNKFFKRDSRQANTNLALLSVLLKDKKEVVDPNKLLQYEQEFHLVQSLRIDFYDNERDIKRAVIKIEHFGLGHYDPSACLDIHLTGTKKVKFLLSESHGDDGQDG